MKKILLITSGQPSLNPRLVKEADSLAEAGFEVDVLYQYWNSWGMKLNEELLKTKKWRAIQVGGDPFREKLLYNITRLNHKLCKFFFRKSLSKVAAVGSIARSSYFLIKAAKRIKADFYIGHNLGALPATVIAAKFYNKKCAFDAEDFHRYETSDDLNDLDVKLKILLEDKFFPQLSYLTVASPLIGQEYKNLYPNLNIRTILNVFPEEPIPRVRNFYFGHTLKLFWFSQTIGTNRGIQDIMKAMKFLDGKKLELNLFGFLPEKSKIEFNRLIKELSFTYCSNINFHNPVSAEHLLHLASEFDIGFATEPGFCFNNKIALSNKIFTYLLGGNAIIFSNTPGQQLFYEKNRNIGFIYESNNIEQLAKIISSYYDDRELLLKHRTNSRELFENQMNWQLESEKFIDIVKSQLA